MFEDPIHLFPAKGFQYKLLGVKKNDGERSGIPD